MDTKLTEALNDQLNNELFAAYTYLAMHAHFEGENWPGFAHWMDLQSREEVEHAMKFYNFILERGEQVKLQSINEPPSEFQSPLDVFQKALAHEQDVTQRIHEIYKIAQDVGDYPTQVFLQWFIEEQVEEENVTGDAVAMLERAGDHMGALMMLDRQFAERQGEEGEAGE
ncbi:MAG: ferritin [Candidatus Bipolaricaulia bacterium]